MLQLVVIMKCGRCNQNLDFYHRFVLNTKSFFFLPYKPASPSWAIFFIGAACWLLFWTLAKIPFMVLAYSGLFSWGLLLLSSMVNSTDNFYLHGGMAIRYYFTSYEIALFLLTTAFVKLADHKNRFARLLPVLILLIIPVNNVFSSYKIQAVGSEFSDTYKKHASLFDKKGMDTVSIPIGPWSPWDLRIPASISSHAFVEDIEFLIESTNGNWIGTELFGIFSPSDRYITLTGKARTSVINQTFTSLLIRDPRNGLYCAAKQLSERHDFNGKNIDHNSFEFIFPPSFFAEGMTVLEIYGQTANGEWHHGSFRFQTHFID